jgi:hypothetical protein
MLVEVAELASIAAWRCATLLKAYGCGSPARVTPCRTDSRASAIR